MTYVSSHTEVELVPTEDDGRGIEFFDALQDACLQLFDGPGSDVAQVMSAIWQAARAEACS